GPAKALGLEITAHATRARRRGDRVDVALGQSVVSSAASFLRMPPSQPRASQRSRVSECDWLGNTEAPSGAGLACFCIVACWAVSADSSPGTFKASAINPASNIAPTTVLAQSQRRNVFCSSELSF